MLCPEKRLYIAIVKQAIKDYERSCIYSGRNESLKVKKKITIWTICEEGTYPLCALAYSPNTNLLKEKLLKTFERLENGEQLIPKNTRVLA